MAILACPQGAAMARFGNNISAGVACLFTRRSRGNKHVPITGNMLSSPIWPREACHPILNVLSCLLTRQRIDINKRRRMRAVEKDRLLRRPDGTLGQALFLRHISPPWARKLARTDPFSMLYLIMYNGIRLNVPGRCLSKMITLLHLGGGAHSGHFDLRFHKGLQQAAQAGH